MGTQEDIEDDIRGGFCQEEDEKVEHGGGGEEEEEEEEEEDEGEGEDDHNFRFQDGMNPFDFLEKDSCGSQPYEQFQRIEYEALAEKKRKLKLSGGGGGSNGQPIADEESLKMIKLGDNPGATMEEIMEAMDYGSSRRKRRKIKRRGRRKGSKNKPNPEITLMIGHANLLYASGEYEEAINTLNEVVRLAPNFPDSYHTLGLIYDALGNDKKAMDFYMIAAHLMPKDPSLWKILFTWSIEHGNVSQARYCLCKAITADPMDVSLRAQLASLYLEIKDYRKAAEMYVQIQRICPDRVDALTTAAKFYLRCGQHEHAVRILVEYIENRRCDADWSAIELLSAIYVERGSYDKALELIQCQEPKRELPLNLMVKAGICHLHLGDIEKAEGSFRVLRGDVPDGCADLIFQLADSYMSLERFDSALEYYRMLEGYTEANGLLHMKLAQCHMSLKRSVEAISYFYKGLNVLSNNVGARLALASLLLEENREDEAISVLSPPEDSESRNEGMEGSVSWWNHGKVRMKLAIIYKTKGMTDQFVDIMTPLLRMAIDVERNKKEVKTKRRLSRTVLFQRAKILDDHHHDNIFRGFRPFASSSDLLKAGRAKRLLEKRKILRALVVDSGAGCRTDSSDDEQPEYLQPERNEAPLRILWEDKEQQALIVDLCRAHVSLQRYLEASDIINGTLKLASNKLGPDMKADLESLAARIAYITTDPRRGYEWVRELLQKDHYGLFAWNCFYRVISRLEISYTKHSKLLRNVRADHKSCVPPIVITGHQFTFSSHYQDAAREYLEAAKLQPENPLINLCAGTSLINLALGFRLANKQQCITQGLAFLFKNLLLCNESQEAIFNVARAFHQIGLISLAVSYYEKVLASYEKDYDIPRLPNDSSPLENPKPGYCDLRREAAYNLHLIYKRSGALDLARQILKDHCTF